MFPEYVTRTRSPRQFVSNEEEVCLEIGASPQAAISLMQRMTTNALPGLGDAPANPSPPPPSSTGTDREEQADANGPDDDTPAAAAKAKAKAKTKASTKKKAKPAVSRLQSSHIAS